MSRSPKSVPPAADAPTRERPAKFRYWTTREVKLLREAWPRGGMQAAVEVLDRTPTAIYTKVNALGIRCDISGSQLSAAKRRKYEPTPEIDEAIRRVYQGAPKSGAVNELAAELELPRWWISKRARDLGLVVPRFGARRWSPEEDQLLEETFGYSPTHARRLFAAAGFKRTTSAIALRRKRKGLSSRTHQGIYTARRLAGFLGVDGSTVTLWIEQGILEAWQRGTERTPQQGGDGWFIARGSVRTFCRDHPERIDLRKVDRLWFLELAFGPPGGGDRS